MRCDLREFVPCYVWFNVGVAFSGCFAIISCVSFRACECVYRLEDILRILSEKLHFQDQGVGKNDVHSSVV